MENTNTDLKFRRAVESIKTKANTANNRSPTAFVSRIKQKLRKFRFPSPWRMEKGHKGSKSPKRFQEEPDLENEHAHDGVCGHSTIKS